MENKTAVEWLIEQIEQELGDDMEVTSEIWVSIKNNALELEKRQHKKTWDKAAPIVFGKTFENYYSETYKKPTE